MQASVAKAEAQAGALVACEAASLRCTTDAAAARESLEARTEKLHRAASACRVRLTDATAAQVEAQRALERAEKRLEEAGREVEGFRARCVLGAGEGGTG